MVRLEGGEALDEFDAHALVGLGGHLAAGGEDLAAGLLKLVPVQLRAVGATHPQVRVVGAVADAVGGGAPGLGGDAAAPQALAAGQGGVVDHRHLDPVLGQLTGAVLAAGSATDDHHVVVPVPLGDGRADGAHPGLGVLQGLFQVTQVEGHLGAVDHPVVGGDGQGHALGAGGGDGEDGRRAGGGDGVEVVHPQHPHVGDHEGGVGVLLGGQAPLAGARHQVLPGPVQLL